MSKEQESIPFPGAWRLWFWSYREDERQTYEQYCKEVNERTNNL